MAYIFDWADFIMVTGMDDCSGLGGSWNYQEIRCDYLPTL
jgi:hypothetical protein